MRFRIPCEFDHGLGVYLARMFRLAFLLVMLSSRCGVDPATIAPDPFPVSLGSRFIATKTLTELARADRVEELVPAEANWRVFDVQRIELMALHGDSAHWLGEGRALTDEMKAALSGMRISDNYRVAASAKGELKHPPGEQPFELVHYVSVVPEQEAEHPLGRAGFAEAVHSALAEAVEAAHVDPYAMQPGRLEFTVDASGAIASLRLASSCGYPDLDRATESALSAIPGAWTVARNASGFPVAQTFSLFFGSLGC